MGATSAEIDVSGEIVQYKLLYGDLVNNASGWFGLYDRHFFAIYVDQDKDIFLVIDEHCVPRKKIKRINWSKTAVSRHFEIEADGVVYSLDYQKLWWNLFFRPAYGLMNVLLVDDWWGVVADLPGWVESNWTAENLAMLVQNNKAPDTHPTDSP